MPVTSVNLQLLQHYKRPKYAVLPLLTAQVSYQMSAVVTPSRQRTTSSVYVLRICGYAVLSAHRYDKEMF